MYAQNLPGHWFRDTNDHMLAAFQHGKWVLHATHRSEGREKPQFFQSKGWVFGSNAKKLDLCE